MGDEQQIRKARPSQPTASGVKALPKVPKGTLPKVAKGKPAKRPPKAAPSERPEELEESSKPTIDLGAILEDHVEIDIRPTEPPELESMKDSNPPPKKEASGARISVPSDVTGDLPGAIARFGRFDIVGRLNSGGMADLFLARETTEGDGASRHTVIKVIKGEHSEHGSFAEMFLNEGRLAMRLTHPNICTVYECGRQEGRYFMAMEFVHGVTLRDLLVRAGSRKRKLEIPVVLKLFSIVAEALDFAHRARDPRGRPLDIVHRDVSPQNIMVRYDGVVKLLDFGVAKASRSSHQTESGALKGKFSYMSPEQALSDPLDSRADIFSLGVVLFESITGRRLFHRKAQYDTLKAILETEVPSLSTYREDIPEGLDEVLGKALAKRADERYQTAGEFQHALESLLAKSGEVVSTSRIARVMKEIFGNAAHEPLALETGPDVTDRFAAIPDPTKPSKLPLIALIVAAVVLAVGGIALGLSMGETTPDAETSPPQDSPVPPDPLPEDSPTEIESGGNDVETDPQTGPGEETGPDQETGADTPLVGEETSEQTDNSEGRRRRRRRRRRGTPIVTTPDF